MLYEFANLVNRFINFLKFEKKYSAHTITSYKTDLFQLKEFLNLENVETISTENLQQWVFYLIDTKKCGNATINRKLSSIKSFCFFLKRKHSFFEDKNLKFPYLKAKKRLPVFLTSENIHEIICLYTNNEKQNFNTLRDLLIIDLLYGTGIRLSELINIEKSDINFSKKELLVKGKRNKQRIIPIPHMTFSNLLKYLEARKNLKVIDNEFLILSDKGKKSYPMLIQRVIKNISTYVKNINSLNPHLLRHTYATHMLDNGADINSIKDLLGHASLHTTQIYTHTSIKRLQEILEQKHPRS